MCIVSNVDIDITMCYYFEFEKLPDDNISAFLLYTSEKQHGEHGYPSR